MPDILRAAYQAALSATEYAIDLIKRGDNYVHETLAKLEAYAEQLRGLLGISAAAGDSVYGSLPPGAKAEVDEQLDAIKACCDEGE